MPELAPTPAQVLVSLVRHPYRNLIRRWNWKSGLSSALIRAAIFFSANVTAGLRAAVGAMVAELAYRAIISGFYGTVTEALRRAEPAWRTAVVAMVLLPSANHSIEFVIHWLRGTPNLRASIVASVCFTALSTLFNLYAMRRGVLIVGEERRTFIDDMRMMPRVIGSFVALGPLAVWRFGRARRS
ncbi:MAG TPA: hypothetical protein VFL57_13445 [Bryobacteraceae bacterium]|nr:hypothetical protein [Bryobacteraceae bacterium]